MGLNVCEEHYNSHLKSKYHIENEKESSIPLNKCVVSSNQSPDDILMEMFGSSQSSIASTNNKRGVEDSKHEDKILMDWINDNTSYLNSLQ